MGGAFNLRERDAKLRVQLGIGLVIAVLLPLALLLFGALTPYGAIAAVLLLAGLWILVFGVTFGAKVDRIYNVAMGLIIAILCTFYFVPARFTLGLVVVAAIAMVVLSLVVKPKQGTGRMGAQGPAASTS
jgi:predicted membrane protein